ncbi:MAG TPA: acyltransferase family protein [Phormidium sp.]
MTSIPSINTKNRIAPVDGLRAVAVFGVIWAHVWAFGSGIPVWSLGKIGSINLDLNRAISVIGTGVDLFFVISGFCMYLMYAQKQTKFAWNTYATFLKKRWLRIAPNYYVAALVCEPDQSSIKGVRVYVSSLSSLTKIRIGKHAFRLG